MKKSLNSIFLCVSLLLTGITWGQGFVLTSLQGDQQVYTSCDTLLTLSISAMGMDSTADVNFQLTGTNFTSSQLAVYVSWGDGTNTTHNGAVFGGAPGSVLNFTPPLQHVYAGGGSHNVIVTVVNPQNNSAVTDSVVYNDVICNTPVYVFASLDCDNNGTADSTITNGVPLIMSNGSYVFTATTNNGLALFNNTYSGIYNVSINQTWLSNNGYIVWFDSGSWVNVGPNGGPTTIAFNLICDSNSVNQSCVAGLVYCDVDSNGVYSAIDTPILNAPVVITVSGQTITTYTTMNGYYTASFAQSPGTPAIISVNQNWMNQNGYAFMINPITVLTGNCTSPNYANIPIDCDNGNNCSTAACASVDVFCDANNNQIFDAGELPIVGAPVQFMTSSIHTLATVYTDSNGHAEYCSNYFPNNFVFAQISQYWMQQHGYTNTTGLLTVMTSTTSITTPGMYAINCGSGNTCSDIWTTVTPWIGYFQGNTAHIKLNYGNYGPGTAYTYTLSLTFPAGVTPVTSSISIPGYTISGNTITWNLTNMPAGFSGQDQILFNVPIGIASGTPHYYTSVITATNNTADCNSQNNNGNLLQLVGSSYDPNDKNVDHEEILDPSTAETLTYVIRFQNTGTAPAQNVYILDTLSANLDWTTFELLETSHAMQVINLGNGLLRFDYPQIWLPDSSANEPESHGHLVYRIREQAGNGLGTEIFNTAYIYFDWNDAIVTNTTYNINTTLGIEEFSSDAVQVFPNPATDWVTVQHATGIEFVELVDVSGKVLISRSVQDTQTSLSLIGMQPGMYLIRTHTANGIVCKTMVKK